MHYSNPVNYFTDGNTKALFTFKPRKNPILFYVQVRTSSHIPISVVIPATDLEDAKNLLIKAMKFRIKCGNKYLNNINYDRMHATEYKKREINLINQSKTIINCINGKDDHYEIIIEKVNYNQFFKVGWASNDTI